MAHFTDLRSMLSFHEGRRATPYKDTKGIWTVGVGHNLQAQPLFYPYPLTDAQIDSVLDLDIAHAKSDAHALPWFADLDPVRQDVVIDMLFNMGFAKFSGFHHMIDAIAADNYEQAAAEMINSAWHHEVGSRALELEAMMRTGVYQT